MFWLEGIVNCAWLCSKPLVPASALLNTSCYPTGEFVFGFRYACLAPKPLYLVSHNRRLTLHESADTARGGSKIIFNYNILHQQSTLHHRAWRTAADKDEVVTAGAEISVDEDEVMVVTSVVVEEEEGLRVVTEDVAAIVVTAVEAASVVTEVGAFAADAVELQKAPECLGKHGPRVGYGTLY